MANTTKNAVNTSKIEVLPFGSALLLDALSGPDDKLGETLLAAYIQAQAEKLGIPVNEISEEFAQGIVEGVKSLEVSTAKHAAVEKAVHLAAEGDFETAGRFIREYLNVGAKSIVDAKLARRFVRNLEKTRESRSKGGGKPKYDPGLQQFINDICGRLTDLYKDLTLGNLENWLRENASDLNNPRETGIPNCDDVYFDDGILNWTSEKGEKKERKLRSLDRYIIRSKTQRHHSGL